jgi:hypothetical protein
LLVLVGVEGFWGTLFCVCVLYPIAYFIKGDDHGSLENPFNTLAILKNSPHIQGMFCLYLVSVLLYNILSVTVTFMLDSIWHAILDNFRPVAVWGIDLAIFYVITSAFGEPWTKYCWIQLISLIILLYGTAVYNAPNPGSIRLTGGCLSCAIDCSEEYERIKAIEDHETLLPSSSEKEKSKGNDPKFIGSYSHDQITHTPNHTQHPTTTGSNTNSSITGGKSGSYGSFQ